MEVGEVLLGFIEYLSEEVPLRAIVYRRPLARGFRDVEDGKSFVVLYKQIAVSRCCQTSGVCESLGLPTGYLYKVFSSSIAEQGQPLIGVVLCGRKVGEELVIVELSPVGLQVVLVGPLT